MPEELWWVLCQVPLTGLVVPYPGLLGALTVRLPDILFQGKLPSAERSRKCPGVAFSAWRIRLSTEVRVNHILTSVPSCLRHSLTGFSPKQVSISHLHLNSSLALYLGKTHLLGEKQEVDVVLALWVLLFWDAGDTVDKVVEKTGECWWWACRAHMRNRSSMDCQLRWETIFLRHHLHCGITVFSTQQPRYKTRSTWPTAVVLTDGDHWKTVDQVW